MAPRRAGLTPSPARIREAFLRVLGSGERREQLLGLVAQRDPALAEAVRRLLRHASAPAEFLRPPEAVEWRTPHDEVGRVLGRRWKLLRVLGTGGSGSVYEARDVETRARTALKLVYGLSPDRVGAVRREIAFLRWLRLPGVVRLLDDGIEDGAIFCVTELVRGKHFPGEAGPQPWSAVEPAALRLLEAVAGIHAAGVVHCDLKPANVLVGADGAVTVLDLGISAEIPRAYDHERRHRGGGTPAYAAPEQTRGTRPDARSDLYSVGIMLHEALTGSRPVPGTPPRTDDVDAPPEVRRVLASLVARRRGQRPRDAWAALEALQPVPRSSVRRRPWKETELRTRFAGPDLLLHLREDGAAELFRRTRGVPRAVERELRSWIRSGLAREEAGLVVVDRPSLERLRILRAAKGVASRGGSDALDREFAWVLRKGTPRQVVAVARRNARRRLDEGRAHAAFAAAFEGASAARLAGDARLERRILCVAVAAAVRTASSAEIDRALLLLQRTEIPAEDVRDLEVVVRAVLDFHRGRVSDAQTALTDACLKESRDDVMSILWTVRGSVAQAVGIEEQRRCVAGIRRWARTRRAPGARGILATAEGWLRYRESRFRAAVARHRAAAEVAPDGHARIRCLLDAATAAADGQLFEARDLAYRSLRLAEGIRDSVLEGRAMELVRWIALRRGETTAPDREFVDVALRTGFPGLAANAAFTEAAIAWRAGHRASARELSATAARAWGDSPLRGLATALAAAAGSRTSEALARRIAASACRGLPPAVAYQVLALLSLAHPPLRAHFRRMARRLGLTEAKRNDATIREVLSLAEAGSLLGA